MFVYSAQNVMRIKKLLILHMLLVACLSLYSQKQANYWYFGENAGLSFTQGVPVALSDGQLNTWEGCSSISTSDGNLEFYTDGQFVYDRDHNLMPHGSGLWGHVSSTQSGIIVPKPGSTTQYYIFTVDAVDNGLEKGLCYTRVDMTLNNGFGDVVESEKNITLLPLTCEKVTAVGHSDGISVWVITHQWGSNAFYAFKVTSTGVNTTPVISYAGPPLSGDNGASKGYIKVSPDGTKIGMANNTAYHAGIFNFNNTSGSVTHLVTDFGFTEPEEDVGGPYGVEFSPNSQLLYIGEWKGNRKINQYDLTSGDPQTILNSKVVVAMVGQNANTIGGIQIGPDNRIYVARNHSLYLSRINQPNIQGTGCGWEENAVGLIGRVSRYGLPPFIQSFFHLSVDFYWDLPVCDGTPVQFYTSASDTPDSVLWNFGDPDSGPENTSTLLNPTHLYPSPGSYWVTLVVYLYGVAKNTFHIVLIHEPPAELSLGPDTSVCAYESYSLDAGPGYDGYLWSNGDTTQTTLADTSGQWWCQVFGDGGCYDIDTINLVIKPLPVVSAGPDITIPGDISATLLGEVSGGSGNFSYHWQPESLLPDPYVLQPQTVPMTFNTLFTLTVTDEDGGCFDSDEMMVIIAGGALHCNPTASPPDICLGETCQLYAMVSGGSGNYVFSWTSTPFGFDSDIKDPLVIPHQNTTYHLAVNDGFTIVNGNVSVEVHELPEPNAGSDQTIPYGTSTTLTGTANGGSGTYSYYWEPANRLINPNMANPTTTLLEQTTSFNLTVTDVATGCVSLDPDEMLVYITGNALAVNPVAQPDTICKGQTTRLFALPEGGAGNIFYSFTWSSDPPGFNSVEENPIVQPEVTTIYYVVLYDGSNMASGNVKVFVNPAPVINLGPDVTVCVFDTIYLDAGNPGSDYIWSNGSTEKIVWLATTAIGHDVITMSVQVTTVAGCIATGQRTIVFDFAACSEIEEISPEKMIRVYPNPGNGVIRIESIGEPGRFTLSVMDIFGKDIFTEREITFTGSRQCLNLTMDACPRGIYFIRIKRDDNPVYSTKYVLIR